MANVDARHINGSSLKSDSARAAPLDDARAPFSGGRSASTFGEAVSLPEGPPLVSISYFLIVRSRSQQGVLGLVVESPFMSFVLGPPKKLVYIGFIRCGQGLEANEIARGS